MLPPSRGRARPSAGGFSPGARRRALRGLVDQVAAAVLDVGRDRLEDRPHVAGSRVEVLAGAGARDRLPALLRGDVRRLEALHLSPGEAVDALSVAARPVGRVGGRELEAAVALLPHAAPAGRLLAGGVEAVADR